MLTYSGYRRADKKTFLSTGLEHWTSDEYDRPEIVKLPMDDIFYLGYSSRQDHHAPILSSVQSQKKNVHLCRVNEHQAVEFSFYRGQHIQRKRTFRKLQIFSLFGLIVLNEARIFKHSMNWTSQEILSIDFMVSSKMTIVFENGPFEIRVRRLNGILLGPNMFFSYIFFIS